MSDAPDANAPVQSLDAAFRLTDRIVGLVTTIVWLGFVLVLGLVVVYVWLVVNPQQDTSAGLAAGKIETLLLNVWDRVLPIATSVLRVVGPVLILFLALAFLGALSRSGAAPFDLNKLVSDLPSVLALVIILTICLLPMSGLDVPNVLNNVALVVVGFYFGKRDVRAA